MKKNLLTFAFFTHSYEAEKGKKMDCDHVNCVAQMIA